MAVIALGAASNLAAIVANDGYMPADPAALASVVELSPGYSNSVVVADPALRPLTDLYALPPAFPFANVFSVGDVLIGIGIALVIVFAMRVRPAGLGGRRHRARRARRGALGPRALHRAPVPAPSPPRFARVGPVRRDDADGPIRFERRDLQLVDRVEPVLAQRGLDVAQIEPLADELRQEPGAVTADDGRTEFEQPADERTADAQRGDRSIEREDRDDHDRVRPGASRRAR